MMRRGAVALALGLALLAVTGAQAGPATQLTDDPAIDWDPSWSPDGTEIAFGSNRANPASEWGFDVWVLNVETLAVRRVSTDVDGCPAWSPDGSTIATDGIWLLNADGSGSPTSLTDGSHPTWSPDGAMIAFYDADDIWVINVDATGRAQITVDDPGMEWLDSHPAWSPDGTAIAFVSDRGGDYAVWTIHPDGTNLRFIHDCPGDWAAEPAWSPDGQWISFQYLGDVYAVDRDGANLRQITLGGGYDGVWSSDGQWVAFTSDRSGNPEIWITADAAQLPSGPTITYPVDASAIAETMPTFTWDALPSADHLCLCLEEAGHSTPVVWQKGDIPGDAVSIAYDADGGARDLELNPGSLYRLHVIAWFLDEGVSVPRWSFGEGVIEFWVAPKPAAVPIQGTILMSGFDPPNASFMSGDSTNITPAAPNVSWDCGLSRDGQRIVYGAPDGLHVCDVDGGNDTALGFWGCKPQWSPDGARIAFSAPTEDDPTPEGCAGGGEIFVVNADGSGLTRVTNRPGPDRIDDWSPDGRFLLWENCTDWQVWISESDGADAHPITGPGFPLPWGSDTPRWSPDGSRILVNWIDQPVEGEYVACLSTVAPDGSDPTLLLQWPLPEEVYGHADGYGWWLDANFPAWSPDASQIAVCSARQVLPSVGTERDMEVYLLDSDGSGLVRVTHDLVNQSQLSWVGPNTLAGGPASVTIGNVTATYEAVVAEGSTTIIVTDELPAPPPVDLTFVQDFTYHLSTTATISGTVTVAVDYGETAYPPVLGERLSLLLWDGAQWIDITTSIDTAGYTITGEFLPGAESDWYVALALDRPGVPEVKVMFEGCTAGRPSGPGLFVADGDLSNIVRLTLPQMGTAALPECACSCGHLRSVWSPDGTRVAMCHVESGELYVMDLTALLQAPGQEPQLLIDELGAPVRGILPAWSPDGDQLAYAAMTDVGPGGLIESINVVNADGTDAHAIYTFPEPVGMHFRYPEWSPDGTRIAFAMDWDLRHAGHLFLLEDLDGPGGPTLRQLTTGEAYHHDSPHWSPDGTRIVFTRSPWGEGTWSGSDIWIKDVDTGVETQVTNTPSVGEYGEGWCPYDGYIYYLADWPSAVKRILPDGTGEEVVASDVYPIETILHDFWWARTGVWIDGLNALAGESVTPKMGIADAENLAGAQAKVRYTGGSDTLTFDSILKAESILDWAMPSPVIGPDVASFLGYASDPETQAVSGANSLFDLNVTNSATAQPGDLQLLTFDDLKLSDDWGDPVERISFDGGVHTIPFAYLEVSSITGPVCADADDPLPFTVMLTALDRDGLPMLDCAATVEFGTFSWFRLPWSATPVTPTSVALVDGSWSGEIALLEPYDSQQLFGHWGDFGGYSNWFQAIGKGDANADDRVTIFDVIKVANMAIERGEWADWQWWAGDLNGDHEVNIFDVIEAANAAMAAMESMGIGRAGAPPVVAPPTEPVIVMTEVSTSGSQVVVAVKVSDCAGLAGIQVELEYDAKKLGYSGVSAGGLLSGASSWSVMGNDLGGRVKAIAYTASAEVLTGGDGTILTLAFNQSGKGRAKVNLTSVELADVEGGEIPTQTGGGKGRGKGKNK